MSFGTGSTTPSYLIELSVRVAKPIKNHLISNTTNSLTDTPNIYSCSPAGADAK